MVLTRVKIHCDYSLHLDFWIHGTCHVLVLNNLNKCHFTIAPEAVLTEHLEGLATFSDFTILVPGIPVGQEYFWSPRDAKQSQGDEQYQESHPEGLAKNPFSVYPLNDSLVNIPGWARPGVSTSSTDGGEITEQSC